MFTRKYIISYYNNNIIAIIIPELYIDIIYVFRHTWRLDGRIDLNVKSLMSGLACPSWPKYNIYYILYSCTVYICIQHIIAYIFRSVCCRGVHDDIYSIIIIISTLWAVVFERLNIRDPRPSVLDAKSKIVEHGYADIIINVY